MYVFHDCWHEDVVRKWGRGVGTGLGENTGHGQEHVDPFQSIGMTTVQHKSAHACESFLLNGFYICSFTGRRPGGVKVKKHAAALEVFFQQRKWF